MWMALREDNQPLLAQVLCGQPPSAVLALLDMKS
jgi:hypothetical protein